MKHYITDPPCAFIEAVVGEVRPIDRTMAKLSAHGKYMRDHDPYWTEKGPTWPWAPGTERGSIHWYQGAHMQGVQVDEFHGEIDAKPSGTTTPG